MLTPKQIIDRLKLQPDTVEGGFLAGTYMSGIQLPDSILPGFPPTKEGRPLCSAIYYLLDADNCSVMHRVTGDMIYHFYNGDPVEMLLLYPDSYPNHSEVCIFSNNLAAGSYPMKIIPGGTWIGSRTLPGVFIH